MESLSQKDKVNIGEIVKDTTEAMEKCKGTMVELRALTKKKLRSKSELDVLRDELNSAITTIQCLQASFSSLVSRPLIEVNTLTDASDPQTYFHGNLSTC